MREFSLWSSAVCFLLVAIFTVSVRREVYERGRRNGELEETLHELRLRNDNASLRRERLASPAGLRDRAAEGGMLGDEDASGCAGTSRRAKR